MVPEVPRPIVPGAVLLRCRMAVVADSQRLLGKVAEFHRNLLQLQTFRYFRLAKWPRSGYALCGTPSGIPRR
ncbi:hypothetical protein [Salipiger sp.]|uniref:hypothetical protein n=1 Tax=Salipiger sp. TaxID=2078585 RepID=UPI003A985A02